MNKHRWFVKAPKLSSWGTKKLLYNEYDLFC